jgi:hypothetical protein
VETREHLPVGTKRLLPAPRDTGNFPLLLPAAPMEELALAMAVLQRPAHHDRGERIRLVVDDAKSTGGKR